MIRLFCREIIINKPELARLKGPLLIAANHPNSFLDAILLDIFFEQPVHSLARGDAFINSWVKRLFNKLHILPVYRTSEGSHNLGENYKTFDKCIKVFENNGIVLIFSEGLCINEWHLRPLKKGTARLAIQAWEKNIPLKVLPVGINYSSFLRIGKNVFINFGDTITKDDLDFAQPEGNRLKAFNETLEEKLKELVFEIPVNDLSLQKKYLVRKSPLGYRILLLPFAFIGFLIHLPLYIPVHGLVFFRYRNTGHKDSVALGILFLLYPLYLALISMEIQWHFYPSYLTWLIIFIFLPITVRALILIKPQLDRYWWKQRFFGKVSRK